ncbi:MAG: peptide deformylase [Anaerolineae bacterium]|nr:peptide deformylase [Anaerolineae bacterium]
MAVREIRVYPDAILRKQAKAIRKVGVTLETLIDDMVTTMRDAKAFGLAANQIGALQRVLVYDDGTGLGVVINPKVVSAKGEQIGVEGCLSVPGLQGEVKRADKIVVKGTDQAGRTVKIRAEGLLARILQHEIDHLNGKLFIDRARPETLYYVTEEESAEE